MVTGSREHRQHPRVETRLLAVFRKDLDLEETDSLMTNLSLGGAFVKTPNLVPPGTVTHLRFYVDEEQAPLAVVAEVVWVRRGSPDGGGPPPGMGVRFQQMSPEDQGRLTRYLARLVEEDLFGAGDGGSG
ncbi:MAG TPA: PilZ domain-containing protein [Myxococcota bacterium]|nr:PilZ domain-containing protein [Myxococcota bacterium]HQK51069.1 PilZ domain-containing protein [Myxococcota bacterium]